MKDILTTKYAVVFQNDGLSLSGEDEVFAMLSTYGEIAGVASFDEDTKAIEVTYREEKSDEEIALEHEEAVDFAKYPEGTTAVYIQSYFPGYLRCKMELNCIEQEILDMHLLYPMAPGEKEKAIELLNN